MWRHRTQRDVEAAALDPVLEAGLEELHFFVYRRHRWLESRPPKTLDDPSVCAGAIHLFKHLKHHGYTWEPDVIRSWATEHGWKHTDALKLSEYSKGVLSGQRYHTRPDPFGRTTIERWRAEAHRKLNERGRSNN